MTGPAKNATRLRELGDRLDVDSVERRLAAEAAASILRCKGGKYAERPVVVEDVIALASWLLTGRTLDVVVEVEGAVGPDLGAQLTAVLADWRARGGRS